MNNPTTMPECPQCHEATCAGKTLNHCPSSRVYHNDYVEPGGLELIDSTFYEPSVPGQSPEEAKALRAKERWWCLDCDYKGNFSEFMILHDPSAPGGDECDVECPECESHRTEPTT